MTRSSIWLPAAADGSSGAVKRVVVSGDGAWTPATSGAAAVASGTPAGGFSAVALPDGPTPEASIQIMPLPSGLKIPIRPPTCGARTAYESHAAPSTPRSTPSLNGEDQVWTSPMKACTLDG